MNVNLTPELERMVERKVNSGLYNSASEVVREALRLMNHSDELKETELAAIRKKIDAGYASSRRGRSIDGDAFFRFLEKAEGTLPRRKRKTA